LFFVSCQKDPSLWQIENLSENKIVVLGHGGSGIHSRFPMNSKESILDALRTGANGSEMDVSVTKDSVVVLYHNQRLEDETNCVGEIKTKTWEELKECRYKYPLLNPAALLRADELFEAISEPLSYTFTFDCKVLLEDAPDYLNVFASALVKHIEKYNLESTCLIESFNTDFLKLLHQKNSSLRLCLYTSDYLTGIETSQEVPLYGITLDYEKISAEEIQSAHEHNLRVALFNLRNEKDNLSAIEKSPDYLQTDKLEFLVEALR